MTATATTASVADIVNVPVRPPFITIAGEPGLGKTTLAALFPDAVFIRAEDGAGSVPWAKAFPLIQSSGDALAQLAALYNDEHAFRTVIIDSVTTLNSFIEAEIVASDSNNPRSINQALGGYGAGLDAAARRHGEIRYWCDCLNYYRGMTVIFIAHADTEKVTPPDAESYTRYTLRMPRKSQIHYDDNVDLVGFIKQRTLTRKADGERQIAFSDGKRVITCYPTPNHISKNRFGINEDIDFTLNGENPLMPFIPYYG